MHLTLVVVCCRWMLDTGYIFSCYLYSAALYTAQVWYKLLSQHCQRDNAIKSV